MKYEWKQTIFTPEDLEGAGQYIIKETINKENSPHILDTGYLSTIMKKVGWVQKIREDRKDYSYILIDMSDGLITEGYFTGTTNEDGSHNNKHNEWVWNDFSADTSYQSKLNLCEYLNNSPYKETFRFATNEELIRVAAHQKWRTK